MLASLGYELHVAADYARMFGGNAYKQVRRYTTAAALTAGGIIASLRHPGNGTGEPTIIVVTKANALLFTAVAASAAGNVGFALTKATAYTAEDTGGTAVTPSKLDSRMGAAIASFMLKVTGVLTAGTRTLDSSSIGEFVQAVLAAAPGNFPSFNVPLINQPLILRPGEGLELSSLFASPTSHTGYPGLELEWAEVPEKNFPF
jgi:hypothetical protein